MGSTAALPPIGCDGTMGGIELRSLHPVEHAGNHARPRSVTEHHERQCFICLMEGDSEQMLVPSCSTCYACVHPRCWREWRTSQRVTTLRARLLGTRVQADGLLRCSICKSGTAVVAGEEDGLGWMDDVLCSVEGSARSLQVAGPEGQRDALDEATNSLEEVFDEHLDLTPFLVCLCTLFLVLVGACALILLQRFYAGDIVLCSIIAVYELSVLQLVAIVVVRRRGLRREADAQAAAAAGGQQAPSRMLATAFAAGSARNVREISTLPV